MKKHWLLMLIVVLGFLLRFWQLNSLPGILNRDEAALAYNALLLQQSGKDEWGRTWPLALESFGDYKLPGYSLILTGLFTLAGYQDWVVRLPSALAGVGLILIAYAFARKLQWSDFTVYLTAFVVAVTPVFIFYSRMAFEANVGLFLTALLIYLVCFPAKNKRLLNDVLAILITAIGVFTYNTPFLLMPFIIFLIPLRRGLKQSLNWSFLVVGLLVVWVAAAAVLLPLNAQKSGITIFSDPLQYVEYIAYREKLSSVSLQFFGSKYVYWGIVMGKNFLRSFLPDFLVIKGGSHPWHQVPGTAHLYWLIYLLGLDGILNIFKKLITEKKNIRILQSNEVLLLYLLIISLMPSITTVDAPHATRSLLFFFVFSLVAMYCIEVFKNRLTTVKPAAWRQKLSKILIALLVMTMGLEVGRYLYHYFVQYPTSQYAIKPGYTEILAQYEGEQIFVIDTEGYQYIIDAWYHRFPPTVFFATIKRDPKNTIGFSYGSGVGNSLFVKNKNEALEKGAKAVVAWDDNAQIWKIDALQ